MTLTQVVTAVPSSPNVTWVSLLLLINTVLTWIVGVIVKNVMNKFEQLDTRVNRHAQRLTALDQKTED